MSEPDEVDDPQSAERAAPAPPTWRERMELLAGGGGPPPPVRVAGTAAGVVGVVLVGWLLLRDPPAPVEASLPVADVPAVTSTTSPAEVVAHAAGAVHRPGLYRLRKGSRIDDLLRAAGGALGDADLDRVNLAAPVADGVRVHVPRRGEPGMADDGAGGGAASAPAGPLDLNTATAVQLDALPGVGPATAEAIIAERGRRGRFRTVDDLLDVRGIGAAKLDALRDLVTV